MREIGARERTRTSTTLRSLAPEASASASSATRARVQVHPDRVGVTLEMLTTAQPESHMQRSIFILPANAPFVNATRVQCRRLGTPASPEAQRSHRQSPVHARLTPKAWPKKSALVYSSCPIFSRILAQALGRQTHDAASILIILCTRIFNPKCYTPPYQTQITPCRPGRHRGSVPTGGQPWIHKR